MKPTSRSMKASVAIEGVNQFPERALYDAEFAQLGSFPADVIGRPGS
jgi:hypothetical protein